MSTSHFRCSSSWELKSKKISSWCRFLKCIRTTILYTFSEPIFTILLSELISLNSFTLYFLLTCFLHRVSPMWETVQYRAWSWQWLNFWRNHSLEYCGVAIDMCQPASGSLLLGKAKTFVLTCFYMHVHYCRTQNRIVSDCCLYSW